MKIANTPLLLTVAISLSSALWQPAATADVSEYHRLPNIFSQAERAIKRGNSERALNLLQERKSSNKHSAYEGKRYELICKAHHQQQNFEKAETFCDMAVATEQSNWNHYNNRGVMLYKMARYSEALSDFEHAASIMVTASTEQSRALKQNILAAERRTQQVTAR